MEEKTIVDKVSLRLMGVNRVTKKNSRNGFWGENLVP